MQQKNVQAEKGSKKARNLLYQRKKQRKILILKNLEEQKAKAKEKINRMLDDYYAKFSERSNARKFTNNDIEELMKEQKAEVREA